MREGNAHLLIDSHYTSKICVHGVHGGDSIHCSQHVRLVNACVVNNNIDALVVGVGYVRSAMYKKLIANLVSSKNEGNSSRDTLIAGDIHCKQLTVVAN